MSSDDLPGPRIRHIDDSDSQWIEVKAQQHGDKRVSIWEKWLEFSPTCLSLYARYDPNVVVERHGGEYLVRGGEPQALEGGWKVERLIVLRFPSEAAARAFVDDPDYAPVKAIRHATATSKLLLAQGADGRATPAASS